MYWLTNPEHGVMPVPDLGEVERHKKWGWTLLNQGERPERVKPTESLKAYWQTASTELAAIAPKEPHTKRGPGRPKKV